MIPANIFSLKLPLEDPVLIFTLILFIILFSPILLNRIRIPHLIVLILAGAIIGPNGFNLLLRDSSVVLFGTVGLLYIMFLAGIEIDLAEFKKNSGKSLVFGMFTFLIPMGLGIVAGIYILRFSVLTSVLLASMFASHTLIAYPIVSKLGVVKNRVVSFVVGGTMITDTLALLVLAVIVGMSTGTIDNHFWIRLSLSIIVFGLIVMLGFPIVGRWFFKRFDDNISQYIFVLGMVFLGAFLAEVAGIEAIIGAFLAGLSLNRLIPQTSPLMNRIEFIGNALFIPFFLIGVGMLVDFKAFFKDLETILVAITMTVVAIVAKFAAAWITQKTYRYNTNERRLIFGLSSAQAAATLAAILVGYNVILGETETGEPIRLLNESVLNGTILMILVTCTVASFVTQKGAQNLARTETDSEGEKHDTEERILIPLSNVANVDELVHLSTTIKTKKQKGKLVALNIITSGQVNEKTEKEARKMTEQAVKTAAASDHLMEPLIRYDLNVVNGISAVVKEQKITDLVIGLHEKKGISDSFLGNLTEGVLTKCNTTTLIYKPHQPLSTIKRYVIAVPENAEKEYGFFFWLLRIWNIGINTGAKLVFYASENTGAFMKQMQEQHSIDVDFNLFTDWDDFLILSRSVREDDNLVIIMSRKMHPSYKEMMAKIPAYLNKYFRENSYILVYPMQWGVADYYALNLNTPSLMAPLMGQVENLTDFKNLVTKFLKKRT
ncbi:cation:proton antiporter [Gaoshiqia sp. Z1-71]|uniref:cation:proton antiporter domain-containing protein n=1 Tax=Gaoshiqia hydrogeniformans TaxID=3290090 RepID=UPI003BF87379